MSSPALERASLGARLRSLLSHDLTGGVLLLLATVLALILANSPLASVYAGVRDTVVGPAQLHLDLSMGAWAADGLLAIFFFVVGLELKHEFVAGRLRSPLAAALPIAAGVGGVIVPALFYVAVNLATGTDGLQGWAVPAATDIAFAVALLAVLGRHLPPALRVFLLTLAVVDDLLAITIIAVFYSDGITLVPLLLALLPLALFAVALRRGLQTRWLLIPLAVVTWALVHASGIHATIAGVALGLVVPAVATARAHANIDGSHVALAGHYAHRWNPWSSFVAIPVFAFFAAGVNFGGLSGLSSALTDPVAVAVAVALVIGKPLGITGAAALMTRAPGVRLDPSLRWPDILAVSFVGGIGFTVSLLIGELAFDAASTTADHVKIGVLAGSLVAASLGGGMLHLRSRAYARRRNPS